MNIINYIYDKGKRIYNRGSNISSSSSNSPIENENLISNFSDITNHHENYNSNYNGKRQHKSSLSPVHFLKLNGKILKKKRNKYKDVKKDIVFINRDANRSSKSDLYDTCKNEEISKTSKKTLEYSSCSKNDIVYNSNYANKQVRADDVFWFQERNKQRYNIKEVQAEKEEKRAEENKKEWCTDPNFNEHILAEGGFKVDYIRHDKKIYQNRCDGVCALNDNIYIFDKIKKSIYLYTPYNNVWHIFLDIYEEMATRKKAVIPDISDNENGKKKENENSSAKMYIYLNNISFTNYTDMVFLNNCIFIISSNSQFMNMCKVNIKNMSTIFNTIIVDSLNESVSSFEEMLKSISKNNKSKKSKEEKSSYNNKNTKREDFEKMNRKDTSFENCQESGNSSVPKKEIPLWINTVNQNCFEKKKIDNISNSYESDDYNEYTKGAFEIGNIFKEKEKQNASLEMKKGKEKKIIKPRDLFSICSVHENNYSLIYLFGGKGNSVKHKNEYIDNIYNDLYVYDFYKNKWIELYVYKSNDKETEVNNSTSDGKDMGKNSFGEWDTLKELNGFENQKDSNQLQCKKSFAKWEKEQCMPLEENASCSFTCIKNTAEVDSSKNNINLNEDDSYAFSDFENCNFFNFNEKTNGNLTNFFNEKESGDTVSTYTRLDSSNNNLTKEINLIKLSSESSNSHKLSSMNSKQNINPNFNVGNDIPLINSKEYTSNEKCIIYGGKKNKEFFCTTCASQANNVNKKISCKYICDLQKNNITLRKLKWLHKRAGHSCVYYKNNLYFFGGISYYSFTSEQINLKCCNNLYLYNIESNECFELLTKGKIPEKRYRHSCVSIGDYMFVIGGETQNSTLPKNDIFYYNFSNSVWTEITLNSQTNFHSLYKTVWLENFGSIYLFGSSILRLTKKDFQYTPAYRNKKKKNKNLSS